MSSVGLTDFFGSLCKGADSVIHKDFKISLVGFDYLDLWLLNNCSKFVNDYMYFCSYLGGKEKKWKKTKKISMKTIKRKWSRRGLGIQRRKWRQKKQEKKMEIIIGSM